jgi:hypothetical protein
VKIKKLACFGDEMRRRIKEIPKKGSIDEKGVK